ncbi:MAG: glycosyltransferase involved in cell wall biosynthesis [Flavobacteriaceae bacterium]|jgi:glycosyltransferase involved in cell wall biosynthesis
MMSKKPRAVVSVTNDLYTDQRVHKVCTFLLSQGYDVLLVGRKRKSSIPLPARAYATKRIRLLFETGAKFYALYNFRLFFYLLFKKADVLVSNDLDTLLANYLAKKFKRKTRLVYDSHEYFTEVPELINRPKVQRIWLKIERTIFPKLTDVYTVNQSIADIYSEKYSKKIRVVRNISPLWIGKEIQSKSALGIPENIPLIIMQGAGINIGRGAEEAVEAMKTVGALLLIVGDGDVVPQLKEYVKSQGDLLDTKVQFIGKQPYDVMMNYTYHAAIGLTLDKPLSLNYTLSLPNKVFDYMHTTTAVVATNIKEVANVVKTLDIGVVLADLSVEHLAETLNALIANSDRLKRYHANCQIAAKTENWENETRILKEIYPKIE